ncbi:N-carbamoyl-L-amino acid hydrolase [Enterobacter cloacae]|uniref:N-carbamoyl-L-amino acid hydrolase n=1 Tax=Enterobacter cloacae TaxID=550 RepID=A0A377M335_ENTCL|nr:N-carbamoyl-L-amino acid hydrolase [Enterobacter cloacae]
MGSVSNAEEFYRIAATPCDARLQSLLGEAVTSVQGRTLSLPSGAGHDTIALAERWPGGDVVCALQGGHQPPSGGVGEWLRDVALAIEAFGRAVRALADGGAR